MTDENNGLMSDEIVQQARETEAFESTVEPTTEPTETVGATTPTTDEVEVNTESEAESENTTGSDTPDEPEKPKVKGVQKRIDELVGQREESKRLYTDAQKQNEVLLNQNVEQQRIINELRQGNNQPEAPQNTGNQPKPFPTLEQFDYDESEYSKAVSDYVANEAQTNAQTSVKEYMQQQEQQKQLREFEATRSKALADGMTKYDDFQKVVMADDPDPSRNLSPNFQPAIVGLDNAAEVAYELGKNRDLVQKLNQMQPMNAIMEIARISERLKAPAPTKISNAPDPLSTIDGGEDNSPTGKDVGKMTPSEYQAWRKKGK